jgi:hypothetical protein
MGRLSNRLPAALVVWLINEVPAVPLPGCPAAHVAFRLDGELHDVEQVHGDLRPRGARRTAERNTVHMSMATTSTRSRQAGGAWSSQYAASSAVRPST